MKPPLPEVLGKEGLAALQKQSSEEDKAKPAAAPKPTRKKARRPHLTSLLS